MTITARPTPSGIIAIGAGAAAFEDVLGLAELPAGAMRRITFGDLDVLLAHTPDGIVAVDDRCPHMAAPLSLGELEGCVVQCPLHEGRFDLCSGEVVQMPTTGGLDADGRSHPVWTPGGKEPKADPQGLTQRSRLERPGPTRPGVHPVAAPNAVPCDPVAASRRDG